MSTARCTALIVRLVKRRVLKVLLLISVAGMIGVETHVLYCFGKNSPPRFFGGGGGPPFFGFWAVASHGRVPGRTLPAANAERFLRPFSGRE